MTDRPPVLTKQTLTAFGLGVIAASTLLATAAMITARHEPPAHQPVTVTTTEQQTI